MRSLSALLGLMLALGCSPLGGGNGGARSLLDSVREFFSGRTDWEAVCLKPTTASCIPYLNRLKAAAFGECCRMKCESSSADEPSCRGYLEAHPVTRSEYWLWPKLRQAHWATRFVVQAPEDLVEYLRFVLKHSGGHSEDLMAVPPPPELGRDLRWAWDHLSPELRQKGERLLVGIAVVQGLGQPSRVIAVREPPGGQTVAGFLVLDWLDSLRPWGEWLKLRNGGRAIEGEGLVPDRRATLLYLLGTGIRQIEEASLSSADGKSAASH